MVQNCLFLSFHNPIRVKGFFLSQAGWTVVCHDHYSQLAWKSMQAGQVLKTGQAQAYILE
jgi:hypothetical protein